MRAVLSLIIAIGWFGGGAGIVSLADEAILRIRIEAEVRVQSERFRLGDIATVEGGTPSRWEQLKQIELGASPLPGQKRLFTRQQLITRLRQHGIDPRTVQIAMPDTVRITRAAQSLPVDALVQFAREQLKQVLGDAAAQWRLDREQSLAPLALSEGELTFEQVGETRISTDSATLEIAILVDGQPKARQRVRFLAPPRNRTLLIRAGEAVQVQVRVEGVLLEVSGVARASGADEEIIPVYIPTTQKTVRARIIDRGRVEVIL
ncbi:hypothetical protein HRbin15_01850 [bacterium HR15]|nr:hypothetical protein HRbin15_01850 [bacterium HR15]